MTPGPKPMPAATIRRLVTAEDHPAGERAQRLAEAEARGRRTALLLAELMERGLRP